MYPEVMNEGSDKYFVQWLIQMSMHKMHDLDNIRMVLNNLTHISLEFNPARTWKQQMKNTNSRLGHKWLTMLLFTFLEMKTVWYSSTNIYKKDMSYG